MKQELTWKLEKIRRLTLSHFKIYYKNANKNVIDRTK